MFWKAERFLIKKLNKKQVKLDEIFFSEYIVKSKIRNLRENFFTGKIRGQKKFTWSNKVSQFFENKNLLNNVDLTASWLSRRSSHFQFSDPIIQKLPLRVASIFFVLTSLFSAALWIRDSSIPEYQQHSKCKFSQLINF